jgi:twitching motility protein PilT
MAVDLGHLLEMMVSRGASDLHIASGSPPRFRVDGALSPLAETEALTPSETQRLAYGLLSDTQRQQFEANHELDFAFAVQDVGRFRCNVYRDRGAVAAAIRGLPLRTRSFDELGVPPAAQRLAERPRGLILVTGPTGSGKSTTLATMIDKINTERPAHIMTVEDPIEFIHRHKRSLVNQREVPADTHSFRNALRAILRQDPDVVLIGEMRDLETIAAALSLAESGHLTLGTLHTNSCAQTMHRIIDVFPPQQQDQVRAQLSLVLEGVLSQALIPQVGGGRTMALEIMVATPAIRNLIRENKVHQMYGMMQSSAGVGMQTMNASLASLVKRRLITSEDALAASMLPDELARMLGNTAAPAPPAAPASTHTGSHPGRVV